MTVKKVATISERFVLPSPTSFTVTKPKIRPNQGNHRVDKKPQKSPWYVKSFNEFCNATALHGYGYIVRKEASFVERFGTLLRN